MIPILISGYDLMSEGGACFITRVHQKNNEQVVRLGYATFFDREVAIDVSAGALLGAAALVGGKPPSHYEWFLKQQQNDLGELLAEIKDLELNARDQAQAGVAVSAIAQELALSEATRSDAISQFQQADARIGELEHELLDTERDLLVAEKELEEWNQDSGV